MYVGFIRPRGETEGSFKSQQGAIYDLKSAVEELLERLPTQVFRTSHRHITGRAESGLNPGLHEREYWGRHQNLLLVTRHADYDLYLHGPERRCSFVKRFTTEP